MFLNYALDVTLLIILQFMSENAAMLSIGILRSTYLSSFRERKLILYQLLNNHGRCQEGWSGIQEITWKRHRSFSHCQWLYVSIETSGTRQCFRSYEHEIVCICNKKYCRNLLWSNRLDVSKSHKLKVSAPVFINPSHNV